MIIVDFPQRLAYIDAGTWYSKDKDLAARLNKNYTFWPEGSDPSNPDPDNTLAEAAVAGELGAEIVERLEMEEDDDDPEAIY